MFWQPWCTYTTITTTTTTPILGTSLRTPPARNAGDKRTPPSLLPIPQLFFKSDNSPGLSSPSCERVRDHQFAHNILAGITSLHTWCCPTST